MKKKKDEVFNPRVLTWLRERQDLSQRKLASMIEVTNDTISCWERSVFDCKQTDKLAKIFDVPQKVFFMTDSEFATNHLQMFPADFPNLIKLAIDAIYEQFDNGEYNDAISNLAKIKDHITLATAMFSSEPSAAQIRDLETLADAKKDDDDIDDDDTDDELIDDADPRK